MKLVSRKEIEGREAGALCFSFGFGKMRRRRLKR
jgi:hypothetical protein